jgi:hypothetical protein
LGWLLKGPKSNRERVGQAVAAVIHEVGRAFDVRFTLECVAKLFLRG